MSALPLKPDMFSVSIKVRFVSEADSRGSDEGEQIPPHWQRQK